LGHKGERTCEIKKTRKWCFSKKGWGTGGQTGVRQNNRKRTRDSRNKKKGGETKTEKTEGKKGAAPKKKKVDK